MENTQETQMDLRSPLEISTETEEKWDDEEAGDEQIELPSLPPQPNLQKMGPEHPYNGKSGNGWLVLCVFMTLFFATLGFLINEYYTHPSVNTATANQCIADNGVPVLNSREITIGCKLYTPTPTIDINPTQTLTPSPTPIVPFTNSIIPPSVPNTTAIVSPTAGNSATPTPLSATVTP